ncbi:MAG: HAD family phosphatase [Kiritimatiellae bacterium]|nr:HAD family phosphatase [Kiritimatiellia bacterium]
MSDKEAPQEEAVEEALPTRALMFVLEDLAFDVHEIMYSTLKKLLKNREIDLTQALFSAHFVSGRIDRKLPHFLRAVGRERLSEEKLIAEINEAISAAILSEDVQTGLKPLLKKFRGDDVAIGVISLLNDEQAEAVIEKAGLEELIDGVICCGHSGLALPAAEAWWRLVRTLSVKPVRSVAVSSTSAAMRASLKTGSRAFVLESTYTECQDFGGADAVISSLKDLQGVLKEWLDAAG